MSRNLFLPFVIGLLVLFFHGASGEELKFGINYGQVASNLPPPSWVAGFIQSLGVGRVKLYDADPAVLTAFSGTGVEFIVSVPNEDVAGIAGSQAQAGAWLQRNIQPFLPATRIACIIVGNEALTSNDTALMSNLLPAMQAMYEALAAAGLQDQINVTTAHSFFILGGSYPPSAGVFNQQLTQYIAPILNFHSQIGSPFLINAYPYFAYELGGASVPLPYVLFEPNPGVVDSGNGLHYDNMLYAQVDAVHAAVATLGYGDVAVRISETGWPSGGDPDQPGATPENAALYNGNLMQRIAAGQGTPLKPSVPLDVYVFALFNENMKPGPASERNYGLFYPNGSSVYDVGLSGGSPVFSGRPSPSKLENAMASTWRFLICLISATLLVF